MLKNSFNCDLSVVWKRPEAASFHKVFLVMSNADKNKVIRFPQRAHVETHAFSAGGFRVLKHPTFKCFEPLGDLMHASPFPLNWLNIRMSVQCGAQTLVQRRP